MRWKSELECKVEIQKYCSKEFDYDTVYSGHCVNLNINVVTNGKMRANLNINNVVFICKTLMNLNLNVVLLGKHG